MASPYEFVGIVQEGDTDFYVLNFTVKTTLLDPETRLYFLRIRFGTLLKWMVKTHAPAYKV